MKSASERVEKKIKSGYHTPRIRAVEREILAAPTMFLTLSESLNLLKSLSTF
jgi:hypothetical protein